MKKVFGMLVLAWITVLLVGCSTVSNTVPEVIITPPTETVIEEMVEVEEELIEGVSTNERGLIWYHRGWVSKEYIEAVEWNSPENIYFGRTEN